MWAVQAAAASYDPPDIACPLSEHEDRPDYAEEPVYDGEAYRYRLADGHTVIYAFRGTEAGAAGWDDWRTNRRIGIAERTWGGAHRGFLRSAEALAESRLSNGTLLWEQALQDSRTARRIVFCGHSLGGALAQLMTVRMLWQTDRGIAQVWLHCFGSPRVFWWLRDRIVRQSRRSRRVWRWVHNNDVVCLIPLVEQGYEGELGREAYLDRNGAAWPEEKAANRVLRRQDSELGRLADVGRFGVDSIKDHAITRYVDGVRRLSERIDRAGGT